MQRIRNSWELVKASWNVLKADKELIVFPILSAIGVVIVTLSFIIPMLLSNAVDSMFAHGVQVTGILVTFLFYLVQYFVIFFANTALVGAAMIRLRGGDPTVSDGLRIASSRFGSILGYALIASTVGMILRAISQRGGILGKIVSSIFGLAWNLATFLVVPILAIENVGPIEAVKRSTALLKRTWGEQIAGHIGLGAFFGLLIFLVFIIGLPVIILIGSALQSTPLLILLFGLFFLVIIFIGLISSALNGIYTAAVYQYAVDGRTNGFFDNALVSNAFRQQ